MDFYFDHKIICEQNKYILYGIIHICFDFSRVSVWYSCPNGPYSCVPESLSGRWYVESYDIVASASRTIVGNVRHLPPGSTSGHQRTRSWGGSPNRLSPEQCLCGHYPLCRVHRLRPDHGKAGKAGAGIDLPSHICRHVSRGPLEHVHFAPSWEWVQGLYTQYLHLDFSGSRYVPSSFGVGSSVFAQALACDAKSPLVLACTLQKSPS